MRPKTSTEQELPDSPGLDQDTAQREAGQEDKAWAEGPVRRIDLYTAAAFAGILLGGGMDELNQLAQRNPDNGWYDDHLAELTDRARTLGRQFLSVLDAPDGGL